MTMPRKGRLAIDATLIQRATEAFQAWAAATEDAVEALQRLVAFRNEELAKLSPAQRLEVERLVVEKGDGWLDAIETVTQGSRRAP